jgi:CheY-like chemotaxis protein
MDLYMPEMDGLEVTREIIKERSKQKTVETLDGDTSNPDPMVLLNPVDVYIIALTASASREDRQICIDAGMNDFISKPFTMTEMKSALKTCANKRKKRRKLAQKQVAEMEQDPAISVISNPDDPMLDVETASIV